MVGSISLTLPQSIRPKSIHPSLSANEARRIAANIVKLPGLLGRRQY
jgi:hypothetical protein